MKKVKMLNESLEQFIKKFLPEGKLIQNDSLELKIVANMLQPVFDSFDESHMVEKVFEAFYNLHYPMSVVEPMRSGEVLKPYINTNSNAIFVAVDLESMRDMYKLLEILNTQEPNVPNELKNTYHIFQQFLSDISPS